MKRSSIVLVAAGLVALIGALSACQGEPTAPAGELASGSTAGSEGMPKADSASPGGAESAMLTVTTGASNEAATAAAGAMTAVPLTPGAAEAANFTSPMTASLRFTSPENGAQVTSPLSVCLEAQGITIEPAGDVHVNSGHHHIIIDPGPEDLQSVFGGRAAIAKDDRHVHIGTGAACTTVTLTPGEHKLLGVVADGAHIPLSPPLISQLELVVK